MHISFNHKCISKMQRPEKRPRSSINSGLWSIWEIGGKVVLLQDILNRLWWGEVMFSSICCICLFGSYRQKERGCLNWYFHPTPYFASKVASFFAFLLLASRNFQAENREGEISNNSAFFYQADAFLLFRVSPFRKKVCLAPEKTSDPWQPLAFFEINGLPIIEKRLEL